MSPKYDKVPPPPNGKRGKQGQKAASGKAIPGAGNIVTIPLQWFSKVFRYPDNPAARFDPLAVAQFLPEGDALLLDDAARNLHYYVCGSTGMGKTRFLASMILQDIVCGRPVCVIDPGGDLYDYALNLVAYNKDRMNYDRPRPNKEKILNQYLFLDTLDPDNPVRVNPLLPCPGETVDDLVHAFMQAVRRIFGPLEDQRIINEVLSTATRIAVHLNTLPEDQRPPLPEGFSYPVTLDFLANFLHFDDTIREQLLAPLYPLEEKDPGLKGAFLFWNRALKALPAAKREDAVGSTRRVLNFIYCPEAHNIFNTAQNTLNIPDIMRTGKSLFCRLQGERKEALKVIGTFLSSKFERVANKRRRQWKFPHTLIMDEFQEYCTPELAADFAAVRQKGLRLVCSHQHAEQSPFNTEQGRSQLRTILGMCRIKTIFGIDNFTGDFLVDELLPITHQREKRVERSRTESDSTTEGSNESTAESRSRSSTKSYQSGTRTAETRSSSYSYDPGNVVLYRQHASAFNQSVQESSGTGRAEQEGTADTRTRGTSSANTRGVAVTEKAVFLTGAEEREFNITQLQTLETQHCIISIGPRKGIQVMALPVANPKDIYGDSLHDGPASLLKRQSKKLAALPAPPKSAALPDKGQETKIEAQEAKDDKKQAQKEKEKRAKKKPGFVD